MNREQINAAGKAQVGVLFDMANHTAGEVENWMNLNLSVYKEIMNEFAECCDSAWDIQDYAAAMQWQAGVFRPFLDRAMQYNTRLMGMASGSARELTRAFENRWHHLNQHLQMPGWNMGPWPWPRTGDVSMTALQDATQALMSLWSSMNLPASSAPRPARSHGNDLHALHNQRNHHKAAPRHH